MPVLWILDFGVVLNVVIAQAIGAIIFYQIDRRIFKDEN
jgi:hypothetical protein